MEKYTDEIDFIGFAKLLFLYKRFVFLLTAFVTILVFVVSTYLPKTYSVRASFFVNQNKQSLSGSLGAYSSFLDSDSEIENRIEEVIKSRSMELVLIEKVKPFFPSSYDDSHIQKALNLKDRFTIEKTVQSLYCIEFESKNPKLSFFVVDEILKQVFVFNEKLVLSEKSNVIFILDKPELPKLPSGPRRILNTALGFVVGFFLSVLCVLGYTTVQAYDSTKI